MSNRLTNTNDDSLKDEFRSLGVFYKRMTEADTYLSLLTDKKLKIYERIKKINNNSPECLSQKNTLLNLIKKIDKFLESATTTIILLQIAKQNVMPPPEEENVLYANSIAINTNEIKSEQGLFESSDNPNLDFEQNSSNSSIPRNEYGINDTSSSSMSANGAQDSNSSDCLSCEMDPTKGSFSKRNLLDSESFYSANSVDDEFYDAIEQKSISDDDNNIKQKQEDDYYESVFNAPIENENTNEIFSKNGYLITHLLSQVRIGMDLSKIVLPTFILERRSLLEMYADFLAHTDIFLDVSKQTSPEKRMVAVLKWYVSSFHTAWDAKTAKKPYNPILGEVFKCHYSCSNDSDHDLSFIAEQISHHPPISAFYAKSNDEKISIEGHIWTKSKFYGLSIGVDLVGGAQIYLEEFNERYHISFPSSFAKSILTIPVVEIGGDVRIVCHETNLKAKVVFHLKPFYGGNRHRVTAKIMNIETNKIYYTLEGYWNMIFSGKYEDAHTEDFVLNTTSAKTCKKIIPKLSKQEHNESRSLWRLVTKHLYNKNITQATQHKFVLEQKQREEAKMRKINNLKWFPKHFIRREDGWFEHVQE